MSDFLIIIKNNYKIVCIKYGHRICKTSVVDIFLKSVYQNIFVILFNPKGTSKNKTLMKQKYFEWMMWTFMLIQMSKVSQNWKHEYKCVQCLDTGMF